MDEKQQQRAREINSGTGSPPGDDPNTFTGSVSVTHGAYTEQLPVAQMTIAQVRSRFRDRLDIHPEAMAVVAGTPVSDDTVLLAGQMLTFIRPSGEKGVPARRQSFAWGGARG